MSVRTTGPTTPVAGLAQPFPATLVDAKGDLLVGTADDALSRLAVGADGQELFASSVTSPHGLKWRDPAEGIDPVARYDANPDGITDTLAALTSALTQAAVTVAGAKGNKVILRPGTWGISNQVIVPDGVQCAGFGRGGVIKALAGFPVSTALVRLGSGAAKVFNCRLENITLDCNNIAGSVGVMSTDIQEQCGVFYALIRNFKKYGIQILEHANVAEHYSLEHLEFGISTVPDANAAGIITDTIAVSCHARSIADVTFNVSGGVTDITASALILRRSPGTFVHGIHIEHFSTGLALETPCTVAEVRGHSSVVNLVSVAAGVAGSALNLFSLRRNGATNLLVDGIHAVNSTEDEIGYWMLGRGAAGQAPLMTDSTAYTDRFRAGTVGAPGIAIAGDLNTGMFSSGTDALDFAIGGVTGGRLSAPADGETALLVRRNVGGGFSTQRVSMGTVDSGGTGFKVLRVPN